MSGVKKRLQTIGSFLLPGQSMRTAMFGYEETCEECGCLARPIKGKEGFFRCTGKCGTISDPIPMNEVK